MNRINNLALKTTYPMHLESMGKILYQEMTLQAEELRGPYLLFAYLRTQETEGQAELHFDADLHPSEVRFAKIGKPELYRPEKSMEQMMATIIMIEQAGEIKMPRYIWAKK